MEKKTFWTVVWKDDRRDFYGVPTEDCGIIPLNNDQHGIKFNTSKTNKGRPRMRWAEVLPLFEMEEEAEAYRANNDDWSSIQVTITYKT